MSGQLSVEDLRLRVWRVLSAQQRLGYDFEAIEIRLNADDWARIKATTANTVPSPYTGEPRLFGFPLQACDEVPENAVWIIHKVTKAAR